MNKIQKILKTKFPYDDLGSVEDVLQTLLIKLLQEQDEFNAKRPIADSGFWYCFQEVIAEYYSKIVSKSPASWDENEFEYEVIDRKKYNQVLQELVYGLGGQ